MSRSNNAGAQQTSMFTLPGRVTVARAAQGRAFIFLRRWGANGNGHAGWGYKLSNDTYDCGSMENNSGNPTRNRDETNDAWFLFDVSFAHMTGIMRGGVGAVDRRSEQYGGDEHLPAGRYLVRPSPYQTEPLRISGRMARDNWLNPLERPTVRTDSVEFRRYTEFASIAVESPDYDAPRTLALESPRRGYDVGGNNCADLAYAIVSAYGVPGDKLAWLQSNPQPSQWFDACLEKGWSRTSWPALSA
jgi:hypothetical protein